MVTMQNFLGGKVARGRGVERRRLTSHLLCFFGRRDRVGRCRIGAQENGLVIDEEPTAMRTNMTC